MSRVVIAEPDERLAERLKTAALAADSEPVLSQSLDEALESIAQLDPDVLIVGPSLISDAVFELSERLAESGRTSVVLTSKQFDASLLRRAMRAGVIDAVAVTEPISDITAGIVRAIAASARMRTEAAVVPVAPQMRGKVVTVFSTKGGVGKTMLATNIAVALTRDTGKRVAIVDLDLDFGDVGIVLGIKPVHTMFDVVQVIDRLDGEMLAGFMEEHDSGLKALLAPTRPEDAEGISASRVGQILDLVRQSFDYVVIDTCPAFNETNLAALDRSDEVFLVTMMDIASVKNTRISLQKLRQLGYDNGRIQLVLNRSDSKVLLEPAEVERAIGGTLAGRIPSDRSVPRCVNKGVPIVVEMPRTDVAKSIVALAKQAAIVVEKGAENVA